MTPSIDSITHHKISAFVNLGTIVLSFLITLVFPNVSEACSKAYQFEIDTQKERTTNAEVRIWSLKGNVPGEVTITVNDSAGNPVKTFIKKFTIPSTYLLSFQKNQRRPPVLWPVQLWTIKPEEKFAPGTYEVTVSWTYRSSQNKIERTIDKLQVSKKGKTSRPKRVQNLMAEVVRKEAYVGYGPACQDIYEHRTFVKATFRSTTHFSKITWVPSGSGSKRTIHRASSGAAPVQELLIPKQWFEDSKMGTLKIEPVDGAGNVGPAVTTSVNLKPMENYVFWKNVLLYSGITVLLIIVLTTSFLLFRTSKNHS